MDWDGGYYFGFLISITYLVVEIWNKQIVFVVFVDVVYKCLNLCAAECNVGLDGDGI